MRQCCIKRTLLLLLFSSIPSLSSLSISPTLLVSAAAATAPSGTLPIVYTIAGSDSGGGAGIQADLHAIRSFGCHGCSAITCLTAQNSVGVTQVHSPPALFLEAQLDALRDDLPPTAIKIGMLGTKELAETVGSFLKTLKEESRSRIWVILDPVMISTSGHRLIQEDAEQAMLEHIFPLVDILTPNLFEAQALLKRQFKTVQDIEEGAKELIAMGVTAVLIKGGHQLEGSGSAHFAQDYFLSSDLVSEEARRLCDCSPQRGIWLRSSRVDSEETHGTGCTLSSSIASALALGEQERLKGPFNGGATAAIHPVDACCLAKAYITAGVRRAMRLGQGPVPLAQTRFPSSYEDYPVIVGDPVKSDTESFLAMKASGIDTNTDDQRPTLGRILPIVDTEDWVQLLCKIPGITDIQLRIKGEKDPLRIVDIVKRCQAMCSKENVRLWVNDFWDAAIKAKCFGVHLGQEDLRKCAENGGLEALRSNNLALGISTHSYAELSAALGVKPSYISLGPIFATASKNVQFEPQGLQTITKWRELVPPEIPLVVIGGINDEEAARKVRQAGAECAAVIGAITGADDTTGAVSALCTAMS